MIVLILQQFGGGGGGSGRKTDNQQVTNKIGKEIYKKSDIKEKDTYVLFTNRMEAKGKMTGDILLERINNGSLSLDRETGMWRTEKGLYVIRKLDAVKSSNKQSNKEKKEKKEKKKTTKKTAKKTTKKTDGKK